MIEVNDCDINLAKVHNSDGAIDSDCCLKTACEGGHVGEIMLVMMVLRR